MRAILFLSALLVVCKMDEDNQSESLPQPRYRTYASLEDPGGKDRIQLIYIERLDVDWEDGTGWDFHALIWEKRSDTQWQEFRRISQDDLEHDINNERGLPFGVSQIIHCFRFPGLAWTSDDGHATYEVMLANPHPEKAVAAIDLVSAKTSAAPFFLAITVE